VTKASICSYRLVVILCPIEGLLGCVSQVTRY